MNHDEGFENYIQRVNDIIETIRDVGGNLEEGYVIRKIMLSLPKPYKPKKCAIKECHDLDKYTIDQLLGILYTYKIIEMEDIERERKEATFNVSNIVEDDKKESENLNEIKTNFVRRLKRGTRKYKGELPLKCFNYGRIGHYAYKMYV